ncbi:hypothetical protein U1Q18_027556 [Sarracenia purpurea var. burkii]
MASKQKAEVKRKGSVGQGKRSVDWGGGRDGEGRKKGKGIEPAAGRRPWSSQPKLHWEAKLSNSIKRETSPGKARGERESRREAAGGKTASW